MIAVSVDSKGDTRKSVLAYRRLEPVWRASRIEASAQRTGVIVNHTAITFLVDQEGKERAAYDSQVKAGQVVHDARLLLGKRAM